MDDPKQQLVVKLKEANNILVTVSANPSVDQLAACIGLTILLNKLKKHATAVFSGNVPSTIEFLKPDETLEKNTDSLRDFIIALDKSKADKLRYKVEENIVKIFITPYKTSITQDDLDFSQGDFNVDVVLAIGVREQQELDQAITAHGRILHDAAVITLNTQPGSELGAINWTVPAASSLSELAVDIADAVAKDLVDAQIATALLTGIVAETERFSNEKTSPETMRLSAELMAAGANQQLVASELQQPEETGTLTSQTPADTTDVTPKSDDGTLEITHAADRGDATESTDATDQPTPDDAAGQSNSPTADSDDNVVEHDTGQSGMPLLPPSQQDSPHRMVEPPSMSGELTANTHSEDEGVTGGLPQHEPEMPILTRNEPAQQASDDQTKPKEVVVAPPPELELPQPVASPEPVTEPEPTIPDTSNDFLPLASEPTAPLAMPSPPVAPPTEPATPPEPTDSTLADIEQAVHSPHTAADPAASVDDARNAVLDAINAVPAADQPLPPKADVGAAGYLNVQDLPDQAEPLPPLTSPSAPEPQTPALPLTPAVQPVPYVPEPTPGNTPADTPLTMPLPPTMPPVDPSPAMPPTSQPGTGTPPPPPVPPPMTELPPFNK